MSALIPTPWFWNKLAGLTRGVGARRERVRPEMFLEMEIGMPTIQDQKNALQVFRKLDRVKDLSTGTPQQLEAILPSVLKDVFGTAEK